jgi:hypothetical protein
MPRANRLCLALILALVAAGCTPVPILMYAPEVPGAKVIYSSCAFNSHVPIGVSMGVAGIEALVSLRSHEGRPYVEVRLDVGEGKTLILQDGTIEIATTDPESSGRAEFAVVSLVDTPIVNNYSAVPGLQEQRLAITAPLVGQSIIMRNLSFDRHFWLATYIETASAQDVWLTLPRFTLNGVQASFPPLHFRRKSVVVVAVLNC